MTVNQIGDQNKTVLEDAPTLFVGIAAALQAGVADMDDGLHLIAVFVWAIAAISLLVTFAFRVTGRRWISGR